MYIKAAEEAVYAAVESGEIEIDDLGRIWRVAVRRGNRWKGGTSASPCKRRRAEHHTSAYLQVRVMFRGQRVYASAHRLVWRHIHGPIPPSMVINHKNGLKTDNRPENLEVVTPSGNAKHAFRLGLKTQWGQANPSAKLSNAQVKAIRDRYVRGGVTQAELAAEYGIAFQTVSQIVRGKRRSKQAGPTGDYTARRQRPGTARNERGQFIS